MLVCGACVHKDDYHSYPATTTQKLYTCKATTATATVAVTIYSRTKEVLKSKSQGKLNAYSYKVFATVEITMVLRTFQLMFNLTSKAFHRH